MCVCLRDSNKERDFISTCIQTVFRLDAHMPAQHARIRRQVLVCVLGSSAGVGVFVSEVRAVCFPRPLTVSYQSCINRVQEITTG